MDIEYNSEQLAELFQKVIDMRVEIENINYHNLSYWSDTKVQEYATLTRELMGEDVRARGWHWIRQEEYKKFYEGEDLAYLEFLNDNDVLWDLEIHWDIYSKKVRELFESYGFEYTSFPIDFSGINESY